MINVKKINRLIASDFRQTLDSKKILIALLMAVAIFLVASFEVIDPYADSAVYSIFSSVMYGVPGLAVFIAGAFAYGDSLCNDRENRYLFNMVLKGGVKEYVIAKVAVIFLSAVIVTCLGMLCYVGILHGFFPWTTSRDSLYDTYRVEGGFRYFLGNRLFVLYFSAFGLQYGLLAGNLAVLAAYISLFIKNRMMVYASSFFCFYFTDIVLGFLGIHLNLRTIFSAQNNPTGDDLKSFLLAIAVSVLFLLIAGMLIKRKIVREYLS